jgi:AcrR family transcriptional regulator
MAPAPREPQQRRSAEKKERLLAAARELFAEQGYHATNSKKIAARADVAVGSFYAYFSNKKSLFLEVIRGYYRETAVRAFGGLDAARVAEMPREALPGMIKELIRRLYAAHDLEPGLHREISGLRYTDPEVEAVIAEEDEQLIASLTELLRAFGPSLAVDDPEAGARVLHRAAEEVIHAMRIFDTPLEEERLLAELTAMVRRYLLGE